MCPLCDRNLANRADSYGALVVVWNRVDHRPLPLSRRRDRLVRLLAGKQLGIGLNEQTDAMGEPVLRQACKMGLEGIVSKRLAASYRSGPSLSEDQKPGQLARICCSTIIEQTGRAVRPGLRCSTAVGSSLSYIDRGPAVVASLPAPVAAASAWVEPLNAEPLTGAFRGAAAMRRSICCTA